MRSLSDSLTSDCFGELLDPERRVDGGALARVGVEDDEPVGAVGTAAVQDLVLEVAAKGNNKWQMCYLCVRQRGPVSCGATLRSFCFSLYILVHQGVDSIDKISAQIQGSHDTRIHGRV